MMEFVEHISPSIQCLKRSHFDTRLITFVYENSVYDKLLSQLFPYFSAHALNISSKIWLVLSIRPSVCKYYAEVKFSLVSIDS
jgi:hypothetical protein